MSKVINITRLIGNTDLVKLQKISSADSADIYVKMESHNPGGSVKDRIGLAMITAAEKSGLLSAGGTIIEPTSGNTGIALAMIAAQRGYRCILTMPDTMSIERRHLLTLYGAEIILTPGSEGMKGAVAKAQDMLSQTARAMMPHQFENPANPEVHRQTTAQEIWAATDGTIDAFVSGVGTGGTITGVADVIKKRNPSFHVVAVEPEESPVLSGGSHSPHKIQGIGAGFIPQILEVDLIDEIQLVNSKDAMNMRKRLIAAEGIMAGISSGANICAALRVAQQLGKGKTVVTVVCDTGERYLSMS